MTILGSVRGMEDTQKVSLTADLQEIRQRYAARPGDVERLLSAADAVLETAAEWEASSDARPLVSRGYAAEVFRAAITRALAAQQIDRA
jgi:hypothetical protein